MSRYILPKERIPRAFNQNIVDENGKLYTQVGSCAACTYTKILEVANFIKTGSYLELSKGYMYGRNTFPNSKNPGMSEEYTLNIMLERGTVPAYLCTDYDEIPDIIKKLESRPDILELDRIAKKYAIKGWTRLGEYNTKERFQVVQEYLNKYNFPLAGTLSNYKGVPYHSIVIVGYEDDKVLFHNHTGKDDIERISCTKLSKASYIDCGIEEVSHMKFTDVDSNRWSYEDIKYVFDEGIMKGVSEDKFEPARPLTREEAAVLIHRILESK